LIKYHHGINQIDSERLEVHIQLMGYEALNIDIVEGNIIKAQTHHLNFKINLQSYSFNAQNRAFSIFGELPKMGKYKMEIYI
jgi:hypothetical protein